MSKEIEYEVVPVEDLTSEQAYHAKAAEPSPSTEAGAVALGGKGAFELAKVTPGVNRLIPEKFKGKPSVELGPVTNFGAPPTSTAKPPIPTTVGEFYNPVMVSEEGIGPGAAKNRLHNYDQKIGNALNEKWLANPEPGFHVEGNRMIATPVGADLTPTLKAPTLLESMGSAPPPPTPLTPAQRAMQMVEGVGAKAAPALNFLTPALRTLNPAFVGLGYMGAGTEAAEAYKRLKHGDYGRALVDLAGGAGTLASIHAPHPLAKVLGLGAGLGAHYLNQKLDEKYGRNYREGGLVHLAEGKSAKKPDESLVPQVTLEGDYNYRPDLDPEVSLEQTIKDMFNSPANSLSPVLHPESVIKGLGSAGESLGRGAVTAIPGVFGDFESLGRSGLNYIGTGRDVNNDVQYDELGNPISNNTSYGESTNLVNPHTALPTTEDYLKMLPRATPKFGDDTANSFLEGLGGFLSPLAFEKASPYALKGAKALGQTAAEKMMSGEPWIKGAEFLNPTVLNAVKPKGGNNPMSLGSTLPLEEQGEMGKFLSLSMMDPIQVFETRLKTQFGNDRAQNNKLREAWKEHVERRLNEHSDDVAYGIRNENIDKVKKEAGEEFAQALEKSRLSENDPNIKKLLSPSEIENIIPPYQSWVNGPLKNYITKQMGTGLETDPLLKVINDSDIMPHEIFGTTDRSATDHIINEAKNRREQFVREYTEQNEFGVPYGNPPSLPIGLENTPIGKKTATTPAGQHYEDLIDRTMYPRGTYAFKEEEGFPGAKFLNRYDVIPDFLNQPGEHIGFEAIQNKVIDNLLTGKTPIEKILNQHPSVVVQDMIKEKVAEMKALQKSTEAYTGWRQENHNALPTDTRFTDAEGNPTNKKLVIFDEKMANENPDLLTRNIAQETKDLNHCVGACGMNNNKYTPMVAPHTGVANKTDSTHGPDYLRRIKNGEISIASLRGPNGESKATLELNRINNKEAPTIRLVQVANGEPKYEVKHGWDSPNKIKYFDTEQEANKYIYDYITVPNQFRIGQLKGKDNSKVIGDEYINDAKNWLNHKHQTGELSTQPFDDIKNLPGVYDLKNEGNDNFGKLSRSSDSKDNAAFDAYLQFAQNKIQNDPKLLAKYNSGHLSFSEIMDPYLPRFVTADDLINLLTPK